MKGTTFVITFGNVKKKSYVLRLKIEHVCLHLMKISTYCIYVKHTRLETWPSGKIMEEDHYLL